MPGQPCPTEVYSCSYGHKGYLSNEKADELSKRGPSENESQCLNLPVPKARLCGRTLSERGVGESPEDEGEATGNTVTPPHGMTQILYQTTLQS